MTEISRIEALLGDDAASLLTFQNPKVAKEHLHVPGPDWVERIFGPSDRSIQVMNSLQRLFGQTGRLAGTGYLSLLPECGVAVTSTI